MISKDAASLRDDFLDRLDAALQNVPHGVATQLRAGIAEELDGLDAASTAERIRQLGDPALIAQEAQREIRTPGAIAVDRKEPLPRRRGFAIAAALVFAFGGFIVPVVGWFVGIVMVAESKLWHRWEKFLAIFLPLAVAALIAVVMLIAGLISSSGDVQGQPSGGPQGQEFNPPLVTGLGLWHSGILLGIILIPVLGGWLLWRLRRR